MKTENAVRAMAGTMILISLALTYWVSPKWLFLTLFVGLNLLQSAFTGFCPASTIVQKLGIAKDACSVQRDTSAKS